jgi:soluble lytic murein transglycosylase-like protein
MNYKIPAISQAFYNTTTASLIQEKVVNVIRPNFGTIISLISNITGVDKELIESFIFIESGGNPNAKTPYAYGLMQVGLATASDVLVYEKSSGRLRPQEEALVKKYLGTRWGLLEKVKPGQKSIGKTFITKQDLFKPEFNVLVGSILLGQLINEFTENGRPRLDKIVVVYNTGRYASISKKAIAHVGDTNSLIKILPKGQADYIRKLVGTNGLLDILV